MHEIRLAVCCRDPAACAGIAARLRGAVAEACADPARLPRGYSGAMLIGFDHATVGPLLREKINVLLVAEPCPPASALVGLTDAASASGAQLWVANPDRYLPSRQLIRKQLSALGEPGLVRLHRWEPAAAAGESNELPDAMLRDLDTVLWLVGRAPDRVFAVGHSGYFQVHLGFPHGGMALLDYSGRLPPGDGYESLSVIAASGAAYADDHQNTQLLYRGGCPQAVRTEERAGQLAALAQEFVDALRDGRDLSASACEWNGVFAVADAVRKSLASRQAVAMEACE